MAPTATPVSIVCILTFFLHVGIVYEVLVRLLTQYLFTQGVWIAALAVGNWYGNYRLTKLRTAAREEKEEKHKKEWKEKEEAAYQRGLDFGSGKIAESMYILPSPHASKVLIIYTIIL